MEEYDEYTKVLALADGFMKDGSQFLVKGNTYTVVVPEETVTGWFTIIDESGCLHEMSREFGLRLFSEGDLWFL